MTMNVMMMVFMITAQMACLVVSVLWLVVLFSQELLLTILVFFEFFIE